MSRRYADFSHPRPQPFGFMDWFLVGLVSAAVCTIFLAFMALFFALAPQAKAHEAMSGWSYPISCCAGYDCGELTPDRVKPIAGGYLVDGKFKVLQADAMSSPDGHYHACFPTPHYLKCLFVPPMGF